MLVKSFNKEEIIRYGLDNEEHIILETEKENEYLVFRVISNEAQELRGINAEQLYNDYFLKDNIALFTQYHWELIGMYLTMLNSLKGE